MQRRFGRAGVVAAGLALGIGASSPARAGTDADVGVGAVAADQGDWEGAVAAFERAVSGEVKVKAKNLPKAYHGLGRAHAALAAAAAGSGGYAAMAEAHARAAAEAFRAARAADDGTWGERLTTQERYLAYTFVNLSAGAAGAAGGKDDPAWKKAEELADAALALVPDLAVAHQLRAQALRGEGRGADALAAFEQAVAAAEAHPTDPPDARIGYAAWQAAAIAGDELHDPERALALVERGAALVAKEKARGADAATADVVAGDLDRLRLEVLRNVPERRAEAITAMRASVEATPDDVNLWMALGRLLEADDVPGAVAAYEEARRRAPTRPEPPFLLGALYFNEAVELQKAGDGGGNAAKIAEAFKKARKPMEDAFALDPTNGQAARALATICVAQRDDTAALEWLNKAKALGN